MDNRSEIDQAISDVVETSLLPSDSSLKNKFEAIQALLNLCASGMVDNVANKVLTKGALNVLVQLLGCSEPDLRVESAKLIFALSDKYEHRTKLTECTDGVWAQNCYCFHIGENQMEIFQEWHTETGGTLDTFVKSVQITNFNEDETGYVDPINCVLGFIDKRNSEGNDDEEENEENKKKVKKIRKKKKALVTPVKPFSNKKQKKEDEVDPKFKKWLKTRKGKKWLVEQTAIAQKKFRKATVELNNMAKCKLTSEVAKSLPKLQHDVETSHLELKRLVQLLKKLDPSLAPIDAGIVPLEAVNMITNKIARRQRALENIHRNKVNYEQFLEEKRIELSKREAEVSKKIRKDKKEVTMSAMHARLKRLQKQEEVNQNRYDREIAVHQEKLNDHQRRNRRRRQSEQTMLARSRTEFLRRKQIHEIQNQRHQYRQSLKEYYMNERLRKGEELDADKRPVVDRDTVSLRQEAYGRLITYRNREYLRSGKRFAKPPSAESFPSRLPWDAVLPPNTPLISDMNSCSPRRGRNHSRMSGSSQPQRPISAMADFRVPESEPNKPKPHPSPTTSPYAVPAPPLSARGRLHRPARPHFDKEYNHQQQHPNTNNGKKKKMDISVPSTNNGSEEARNNNGNEEGINTSSILEDDMADIKMTPMRPERPPMKRPASARAINGRGQRK
eukprot:TRINITY_DN3090_c0_g1_i1.p1 TRINITY_DN3090_c0_g1~~TRINITY_DN3090_c0_g1_i1.p1  ORF type:complete len:673 (-),score=189.97 TRINITY_DN3090_c0_g1_i1:916-2934(-)